MEKFCPACSRVYGEDAVTCELDGERLVLLSEEPSLVGHVLDSKYTLISKLGEGGMGSVYLAEQATMGREVAIKVLRREFSQNRQAIKRFLREARAASKLGHPNTITVYDFGQSNDGLLYLVMERLTGRPLADVLDNDGALPIDKAVHIFGQICDSLAEAHRQGITHRDLKPENIFIEQKVGNPLFVKVLDFGIAKMAGDEATTQATAAGMICGTPSYMSPEQAMGKEIDGRSDIYALGILLYEMLTNEKPFEGDTPMEVMLKHINEPSPNVYQRTQIQIPEGMQDVIDRLLAKKADQRPATCEDAKALLLASVGTPLVGPIVSTNDPSLPRKRREDTNERIASSEKTGLVPTITPPVQLDVPSASGAGRRSWMWLAAAVVVLGAAGATIGLALSGSDTPKPETASSESVRPAAVPSKAANGEKAKLAAEHPKAETPHVAQSKPNEVVKAVEPVAQKGNVLAGEVAGQGVAVAGERGIDTQAAAEPVVVAPPVVEKVKFSLRSTPDGADVMDGETLLGKTPLDFERDKDSGVMKLSFQLKGYRTETKSFGTVADVDSEVTLKKLGGGGTKPTTGHDNGFGGTF